MPAKKKQKQMMDKQSAAPAGGRPLVVRGKNGRFMRLSASGEPVHATPHTDIVLSKHAQERHHKAEARPITLQAKGPAVAAPKSNKHGFSFPVALSQVRDRVYAQAKTVKPVHRKPAAAAKKSKPVSVFSAAISPFVLDLKHRRTVVHHALPPFVAKAHRPAHKHLLPSKQGVLSLFEDQGSSGLPLNLSWKVWAKAWSAQHKKQINLTPRREPLTLSQRLRRAVSVFAWQYVSLKQAVGSPFASWRFKRRQSPLQLQWGNTLVPPASYVSRETRSGRPIAARHVHPFLRLRQSLALATKAQPKSLSVLDDEALPPTSLSFSWRSLTKATAPFAAVCAVFVLVAAGVASYQQVRDYRREVLGAANLALRELNEAAGNAQSFDFLGAAGEFSTAAQAFKAAAAVMKNQASVAAKIVTALPGVKGQADAANDLLEAGGALADAARFVSEGAAVFAEDSHFLADQPLSYKLEFFFVRLNEAQPLLERSEALLGGLNGAAVPEEAREQVSLLAERLPEVNDQVKRLVALQDPLLVFLGHNSLQRHLVMFQNNTELRASGGFLGSFALVDMDRGEIKDIEIPGGGPYDMQGSLLRRVQAPRALRLINPRWEFQDVNWFLDWPTSAGKISRFYEQAGGPSVDGVVAVDTQVLERLLQLVGPVHLPGYKMEIDAATFRQVLQQQVEVNYDRSTNKPKQVIADLAPLVLERIKQLPVSRTLELAGVLSELMQERHVLVYHHNADVQNTFAALGWGGEVVQAPGDYLAVVNTNIAGGKTDGVIKDTYDLRVHIDERLQTTHTLTVRRQHTGKKGAAFSGVRNVDYLRVYVPAGSNLISATASHLPPETLFEQPDPTWETDLDLAASEGTYRRDPASNTEVYEESSKTVFAQWLQVDPGQEVEATFVYTVPAGLHVYDLPRREASWLDWFSNEPVLPPQSVRVYSLYWQKQPGAWDPSITVNVDYPQTWHVQAPVDAQEGPGTWQVSLEQKEDASLQLIFY